MTWAARPAEPAGHVPTAAEFATILDQIEALSNEVFLNTVPGVSTNTGAYSSVVAPSSLSFTKKLTATRVKVAIMFATASTVAGTKQSTAVTFNAGADNEIYQYFHTNANLYMPTNGQAVISGLAAGAYTVQLRWSRLSGTGTLNTDANAYLSMVVSEIGG